MGMLICLRLTPCKEVNDVLPHEDYELYSANALKKAFHKAGKSCRETNPLLQHPQRLCLSRGTLSLQKWKVCQCTRVALERHLYYIGSCKRIKKFSIVGS